MVRVSEYSVQRTDLPRPPYRRLCIRGVHGNGEDWDPMGMAVRSAMGWEWDGNGN